MTLDQLRYFQAVALHEHMGRAAEQLHISTPSISVSISNLEQELGVKLFEKEGRYIKITAAGARFLTHTNKILEQIHAAAQEMKQEYACAQRHMRIGYISSVENKIISKLVHDFIEQRAYDITIDFEQDITANIIPKLLEGIFDIGFCCEIEHKEMHQIPLITQPIVLLTPREHPLAQCGARATQELVNQPLITYHDHSPMKQEINRIFSDLGCKPVVKHHASDEKIIAELVERGMGLALVTYSPVLEDYDVAIVPLQENYTCSICLTYCKNKALSPLAADFLQEMTKIEPEAFTALYQL